jgi:hypothetical protein
MPSIPRSRSVVSEMPSSAATAVTGVQSAEASTIRDRSGSACAVFCRRAQPSRACRSSALSTSGTSFGLAITQACVVTRN